MIQLEIDGRRYPVQSGELVFGTDPGCAILLAGGDVLPRHAVVTALPGGGAAIQVGGVAADVRVNGVRLGAEPTPLLHGDKISVGTHDVRVVDERRAGSTQMMAAFGSAPAEGSAPVREGGPMVSGRVVCLTDGREYTVPGDGLVFGRDAACDVVIASTDVSRRHAEIRPGLQGYVLTDSGANGTLVNGQRVAGSRVLARADVIRIGTEEYRFYASPSAALAPPVTSGLPLGAVERLNQTLHGVPVTPPHVTPIPALNDTLHGIPRTPIAVERAEIPAGAERLEGGVGAFVPAPASPPPPPSPPLASLLIRGGALKGKRLPVRLPVVNIGRADYNDIVLPEASVSTAHAKLQRREGVWVISDLGSTNGTTVDGETVSGELPLSPGATIRFGEVAVLFEPMDAAVDAPKSGTRVMPRIEVTPATPPSVNEEPPVPARRNTPRIQPKPQVVVGGATEGSGVSVWAILLFLALAAAAAALVFLR
jgi:pSer/pThr/pTyr-binding forkhead associated (FHA) protein